MDNTNNSATPTCYKPTLDIPSFFCGFLLGLTIFGIGGFLLGYKYNMSTLD